MNWYLKMTKFGLYIPNNLDFVIVQIVGDSVSI